jgi:hypothetical protein
MPSQVEPIARIRLSRSLPRLLALPALALLVGGGTIAGGLILLTGPAGIAIAVAGGLLILLALAAVVVVLSIRLEVEEAAVRLRWPGGERIYALSPGPVTRVRLTGESASKLRGGRRLLGGQLGGARLRDDERIEVVRLAPTPTAILVPTDRGRLAIAAADEAALLDALSRAARARQRLDEAAREAEPVEEAAAPVAEPVIEVDPVIMTGIERALFERRLAEERIAAEAAEAAADAERIAAEEARRAEAEAAARAEAEPAAEPERRGRRLPIRRPPPSAVLVLLPLVGAGAALGIGVTLGRMPDPGTDLWRLTALALVLAGPAATIGAIMARVWWPRLVGVVVAGGLAGAVFVGRALVGA